MKEKEIQEKIQKLRDQIEFWTTGAKNSKSTVQKALLNDKIRSAKIEIRDLETKIPDKEIKDHVDAPVLADRKGNHGSRITTSGISNDSTVFSMGID